MNIVFYIAFLVAVVSTILVIAQTNIVHALLYTIVSLMSLSVIFFLFGAPFIAALEIMIYAGAIMVLFIFVIMMLNLGQHTQDRERKWLKPKAWVGPGILCLILLALMVYATMSGNAEALSLNPISPKEVGMALYGKYVLGVELVAMLLMSATIGAYHIGYQKRKEYHRFLQHENEEDEE